jgi:hypothetical protein
MYGWMSTKFWRSFWHYLVNIWNLCVNAAKILFTFTRALQGRRPV